MKPLNDRELKDATVKAYRDASLEAGAQPDMGAIDSMATKDLTIAKARIAEIGDRKAPKKATFTQEEVDQKIADFERKNGVTVTKVDAPPPPKPKNFLDIPEHALQPKVRAAFRRIKQIITPRGDVQAARVVSQQTSDVCQELCAPVLAKEFLDCWVFFNAAPDNPSIRNPFRGRTPADRARILYRKIEDICDKSTGQFGPWWTR